MSSTREVRIIHSSSGERLGEAEFLHGKAHGITRLWSADGSLTLEAGLVAGEYHGSYKSWWQNGQLKEVGT